MLFLFVTLLSCYALKLSDPVALRDVIEENVSLRSWCVGIGCVMPFTPATCLSWCDWNFDKQADAEARGAFKSEMFGKKNQVGAKDFYLTFALEKGTTGKCDPDKSYKQWFMDPKVPIGSGETTDGGYGKNHIPIFPGADKEKLSGNTFLRCAAKSCYSIQGAQKADAGYVKAQFNLQFRKNVGKTKIFLMKHTNDVAAACNLAKAEFQYVGDLPDFTPGAPDKTGKFVSPGSDCTILKLTDMAHAKDCGNMKKAHAQGRTDDDAQYKKCDKTGRPGTELLAAFKKTDKTESEADFKARKECCYATWGKANIGFGLSRNMAWPKCHD